RTWAGSLGRASREGPGRGPARAGRDPGRARAALRRLPRGRAGRAGACRAAPAGMTATGPADRFVVAGAGLAGSLMATLLGRAGHRVLLLERRSDPRQGSAEAGRSINLAISARGLHALEQVGLRDAILRVATPLYGRMIHPVEGPLAFQPYGTRGHAINSISRADLNLALVEAAERSGDVAIRFGRRCSDLDPAGGWVETVD